MSLDPYLDLEHGVLRNRIGITDAAELAAVERRISALRIAGLERSPVPGDYDLAHLQCVHRRIFSDVYPWAGTIRTVTLARAGHPFCTPDLIRPTADRIFPRLAAADRLRGAGRAAVLDALTTLLAGLNELHPFREGNGRAQRSFLAQLARHAGHPLSWDGLDPVVNATAARAAANGDRAPLRAVIDHALAP
ncbi:Fic family protein [Pseudonocardia sp. NPDC049635]|uniref:Fic/DOC family protein n=1 Tax=Pseudonocardia sp. NPDC049635 TaxID=3155506 RepID=UPI0033C4EA86